MKVLTSTLAALGVVAGVGAATIAYQTVSGSPVASHPVESPAAAPATPDPVVRMLPCREGWTLRNGTCVRVLERVVVVGSTGVAAASGSSAADRGPRPKPREDRDEAGDDDAPGKVDHDDDDDADEAEDRDDDQDGDHAEDHEDHEDDHAEDHDEPEDDD